LTNIKTNDNFAWGERVTNAWIQDNQWIGVKAVPLREWMLIAFQPPIDSVEQPTRTARITAKAGQRSVEIA
jgi:hypothetical protein